MMVALATAAIICPTKSVNTLPPTPNVGSRSPALRRVRGSNASKFSRGAQNRAVLRTAAERSKCPKQRPTLTYQNPNMIHLNFRSLTHTTFQQANEAIQPAWIGVAMEQVVVEHLDFQLV